MNYYQDQEERKRVNNAVPEKDTAVMVNRLIAAIMPEDVPEECEQPDSKTMPTEPAMIIVAAPDDERADLMKYNHLIAAIQDMNGVCSDNQALDMQLNDVCDALKGERCRLFEHLVDWNAIAGGR